jgi:autotransporter-associated beta strand protein
MSVNSPAARLTISNGGVFTIGGAPGHGAVGSGTLALGTGVSGTLNVGTGGAAGILKAATLIGRGHFDAQLQSQVTPATSSPGTEPAAAHRSRLPAAWPSPRSAAAATTLTGANDYTGGTTVSAGTLRQGLAGAFAASTAYTVNGGTLDVNNFDLTASSLSGGGGTVALGSAALTVNQAGNTAYSGAITGSGTLTKSGAGTLTLSGTNSYSGGTTVTAGTLAQGVAGGFVANTAYAVNGGVLDLNNFSLTATR